MRLGKFSPKGDVAIIACGVMVSGMKAADEQARKVSEPR